MTIIAEVCERESVVGSRSAEDGRMNDASAVRLVGDVKLG